MTSMVFPVNVFLSAMFQGYRCGCCFGLADLLACSPAREEATFKVNQSDIGVVICSSLLNGELEGVCGFPVS